MVTRSQILEALAISRAQQSAQDLKSSGYDNAEWYVKRILPIAVLQTLNVVLQLVSIASTR